ITDALENGAVTGENIVESFEKNIYKNFLQTNIPLDPVLARFSAAVSEEKAENLRMLMEEFSKLTREHIRAKLISRLPVDTTDSTLALEMAAFQRLAKTNLRGVGLRRLFEDAPQLMKTLAPCMLMSPITVSQYLPAESGLYDLVIFDEASQIPTAEAICSIARGKQSIIVGDPKQLPPTAFFNTNYVDEDNLEMEDMESILDDCLTINMPQRHLTWHYRSKHESLIAFSNAMYYDNKLCTFPSPDTLASKVTFTYVEDGIYDRGITKRNKVEGDRLVKEVVRRLADPKENKLSIGVVTFSSAQKEYIERKLSAAIAERKLEKIAYDREEPLFVKNLENVQGDERDVILFSVCYGPDSLGRVSLNFGPLNQFGGWRRLNVAVSRAREEMMVFSSMTGAMIDLSKTKSRGVMGLKAFLEFAQKGRTNLAISAENVMRKRDGIGKYIAEELTSYGYDCRYDVGASGFKIDVAVIDPRDRKRFILAIMCDTPNRFSVKDRNVLQVQTLKRNNWNVLRLYSVNYYNNPKREIKKIKDLLDKLTGADKKGGAELNRYKKTYKKAILTEIAVESANYVTSGENDKELIARLKTIVAAEEPISFDFLVRRCLNSLGITKYGSKVEARMQALIALCGFKYEKILGTEFYRKSDKYVGFDRYRVETGETVRRNEKDYTPYEVITVVRGALEDKVALYMEEIQTIVASVFRVAKPTDAFAQYVNDCVTLGEEKGMFIRSVSDRISLA
ncbi:MAG: DNA helicase, partial [Clostridia bacterium]|nr:DNA helicase [Clostridia bacterium]